MNVTIRVETDGGSHLLSVHNFRCQTEEEAIEVFYKVRRLADYEFKYKRERE